MVGGAFKRVSVAARASNINQICNLVIHGDNVSKGSIDFIKKSLPEVLPLLKQIREKAESYSMPS
jgi:hypothetical protein